MVVTFVFLVTNEAPERALAKHHSEQKIIQMRRAAASIVRLSEHENRTAEGKWVVIRKDC